MSQTTTPRRFQPLQAAMKATIATQTLTVHPTAQKPKHRQPWHCPLSSTAFWYAVEYTTPQSAAPMAGIMATIPQFVAKFSTPHTTDMMIGVSEKVLPYPKPTRAVVRWKSGGCCVARGVARIRYPIERRSADGSRKTIRESVVRLLSFTSAAWRWLAGMGGNKCVAAGAK